MKWLDNALYPQFHFDHAPIDIVFQPFEVEHGPAPTFVAFKVQCTIPHSQTGCVVYTADDLAYTPAMFMTFGTVLRQVLDREPVTAVLTSVSREFTLTMTRLEGDVLMEIAIKEFQAVFLPDLNVSAACAVSADVGYRWVRELRDYSERLEDWFVLNRPEWPAM